MSEPNPIKSEQKPVGFICLNTRLNKYRGRTSYYGNNMWKDKPEQAQVFKSEKSARMACGTRKETDDFHKWRTDRHKWRTDRGYPLYSWQNTYYPGDKYTYDNTDQEFIPVYPRF